MYSYVLACYRHSLFYEEYAVCRDLCGPRRWFSSRQIQFLPLTLLSHHMPMVFDDHGAVLFSAVQLQAKQN